MSRHWPKVRLADVLHHTPRPVTPQFDEPYREIGIRSHGRGIFHKPEVTGAEIGDKRVFRIKPGDFVLNIVFAWEGAVAVAGPSEEGMIGSHRFPTFRTVQARLDTQFLLLFFRTPAGVDLLGRVSPGGAGRNRTLNRTAFLDQEIPLPPLAEQRRIVARIEKLATQIHEARALRLGSSSEVEALLASSRNALIGIAPDPTWVPLGRFVQTIENGKSPQCESRPASGEEWGVLKVGAVSFGTFDERENKALPAAIRVDPRFEVRQGDFLMSRANTTELVGACAIVPKVRPKLLLSDKIFRFHFRDGIEIDPRWLDQALKSPAARAQITRAASGTSPTMKNISKEKMLGLLLPPHALSEQRRIVAELDALQAEVDTLKRHQRDTAAELDALLPAILDRAFRGEL